jgi:hypothetical protein
MVMAALAVAACAEQRQRNVDPSTSRTETDDLIAAMHNQPEVAQGKLRTGPDTALLPAPTGPAPGAHAGHGDGSSHQQP